MTFNHVHRETVKDTVRMQRVEISGEIELRFIESNTLLTLTTVKQINIDLWFVPCQLSSCSSMLNMGSSGSNSIYCVRWMNPLISCLFRDQIYSIYFQVDCDTTLLCFDLSTTIALCNQDWNLGTAKLVCYHNIYPLTLHYNTACLVVVKV